MIAAPAPSAQLHKTQGRRSRSDGAIKERPADNSMTQATSPYLNRPLRSLSEAVIDLSRVRSERGLPPHPLRATILFDEIKPARLMPAPGKRMGCRVYLSRSGIFGTVIAWKPCHDTARGGCMLAVNNSGVIYGVHENEVEPSSDAA